MNRKPVRLAKSVPASETGTLKYTVTEDCTLERVIIHFPPGSEGDLHLTPYIVPPGDGPRMPVLELDDDASADTYLSGEALTHDLIMAIPVPRYSKICIDYVNFDAVNAHKFEFAFEIDELGGMVRMGGVV